MPTSITQYREWKRTVIAYLGGRCAQSDVSCSGPLEIDHIDESQKSFNLAKNWGMKDKGALEREIEKCQLLCRKHHKDKTVPFLRQKGLGRGFTHRTEYAWMKKKCACEVCETAKREWNDKRNAARRSNGQHATSRGRYSKNPDHGTTAKYSRGCRCAACREANAEKARRLRASRVAAS